MIKKRDYVSYDLKSRELNEGGKQLKNLLSLVYDKYSWKCLRISEIQLSLEAIELIACRC